MRYSDEQWILFAESAKPRILGMVDTLLQRLREQRDTHIVAIRSAKLSINVLLAHWHHVRTTDTVIVVSSYKTSRFFFRPFFPPLFSPKERLRRRLCIGTLYSACNLFTRY